MRFNAPSLKMYVVGVTRDAGSVTEELGDGDAGAGVLAVVGEIVGYVAIEFDAALGYLLENKHGGELLGDGAEAESDVRAVGDVPFAIGEAVAAFEDNLVVFGYEDGASELAAVGVLAGELVDFGGFVGGLGGREAVDENEKAAKSERMLVGSCSNEKTVPRRASKILHEVGCTPAVALKLVAYLTAVV
jgi:hypothetical protein